MALTIKQKQVADDYIITGNKTESYLKFYKNVKNRETARANSSRLFNTPGIKEYIENKMKELDEELIADQREILRMLTRQARRQEIDYQVIVTKRPVFDDNNNFVGIEEKGEVIKVPTQNKDAIKAAELLGKRYGMWTDKIDINEPIKIDITRKSKDGG
ncbi:MAG: terminase small subunit [Peptoniphilaceae bacterium]